MKKSLLILSVIIVFKIQAQTEISIDKMEVYKEFNHGGSTIFLKKVFENPKEYKLDGETILMGDKEIAQLEELLSLAKKSKLSQQKIIIELAANIEINGKTHHFVFSDASHLILDLTDDVKYVLKESNSESSLSTYIKELDRKRKVE